MKPASWVLCKACKKPSEFVWNPYNGNSLEVKFILMVEAHRTFCACDGCDEQNLRQGVYGVCRACAIERGLIW